MRHLIGAAYVVLTGLASCSIGYAQQVPSYWVLVHAGDEPARSAVLTAPDFAKAKEAAAKLGYEVIVERSYAYFFPVPSWSESAGTALQRLLKDCVDQGFDKDISVKGMSAGQRDHLRQFFATAPIGGDLGAMAQATDLSQVSLSRSLDLKFESGSKSVIVPFAEKQISEWYSEPTQAQFPVPANVDYPDRKELFGLGSTGFSVSVSRPVSSDLFDQIVDRVQVLLAQKRKETRAALDEAIKSAFGQAFNTESAKKLLSGEKVSFAELPEGLRVKLQQLADTNPSLFGLGIDGNSGAFFQNCTVSVPEGGLRVFANFLLGQTIPASDGTPVKYRISWELTEIAGLGG